MNETTSFGVASDVSLDAVADELDGILSELAERMPETAIKSERLRVVVIEDNEDCRSLIVELFRSFSFEVLDFADGAQGFEAARTRHPDLILTDFEVPGMNGYELLTNVRMDDATRKIPVIVLTGSPRSSCLDGMHHDAQAVLRKPIAPQNLLAAVRQALSIEMPAGQGAFCGSAGSQAPLIGAKGPVDQEKPGDADSAAGLILDSHVNAADQSADLETMSKDSSVIAVVNRVLVRAIELGASDIHFEPRRGMLTVRARVDGTMRTITTLPASAHTSVAVRLKIMSDLVITERRLPQDGQFRAVHKGTPVDFRISTLPSKFGEKIVIRILGETLAGASFSRIGMSAHCIDQVETALQASEGLILTAGPTNSGKTTTLYAMLAAINHPGVNVVTVEDPVEYQIPGITQIQVNAGIGLTFERVLRSTLRQDPNVILVGEIRDKETAEIALKASLTGHMVLSSIHTNSAPATLSRLTQMGLEPYLLASAVKLVVSQRLLRRLCQHCQVPAVLSEKDRKHFSEAELGELARTYRAAGCNACGQTGFSGRIALYESMPVRTPQMRAAISGAVPVDMMRTIAVREGMQELRRSALSLAASGTVSLSEAMRVVLAA